MNPVSTRNAIPCPRSSVTSSQRFQGCTHPLGFEVELLDALQQSRLPLLRILEPTALVLPLPRRCPTPTPTLQPWRHHRRGRSEVNLTGTSDVVTHPRETLRRSSSNHVDAHPDGDTSYDASLRCPLDEGAEDRDETLEGLPLEMTFERLGREDRVVEARVVGERGTSRREGRGRSGGRNDGGGGSFGSCCAKVGCPQLGDDVEESTSSGVSDSYTGRRERRTVRRCSRGTRGRSRS